MSDYLIVRLAKERFNNFDGQVVHFVDEAPINDFLNDLKQYPHAFVLACLMDRQIKAEKAWVIPYLIKKEFGTFDINELTKINLKSFKILFNKKKFHRFNDTMADVFYSAVNHIKEKYNGNASLIWSNKPSSSSVVYKFLEFKGSGVKIATMAANILARQFRVHFSDYYSVDISPDVHIKRVMKRMGFIHENANNEMIIYKARDLNPEFPGIIDFSCWEIGRTWCKPQNPNCNDCIVSTECMKVINS